MKGVVRGFLAAALVVLAGFGNQALAQRGRSVIVEQFSGTSAEKFRDMVTNALEKAGIDVVADKKVAATEADLGLLQVADNYPAVARELKAGGFVSGSVAGGKKTLTARLRVRDTEGKAVAEETWTGATAAKLFAAINANLGSKLTAAVGSLKGASGKKDAPVAAAPVEEAKPKKTAKEKPAEVATEEEAPVEKPKKAGKRAAARAAAEEAAGEREDKRDEPSDTVAESAEPHDSQAAWAMPRYMVALGARIVRREFRYNQNTAIGGQQDYKLNAVPAPNLQVEYYPILNAGVIGGYEQAVQLVSEDRAGNIYATKARAWYVGAKGRYMIGDIEANAMLAYGGQLFKVEPTAGGPPAPQVAGVNYKHLRVGVGARVPLTDTVALFAGGNYVHLMTAGTGPNELFSPDYFQFASGKAGEGYAGASFALPWLKGLEARATADMRRYVFTMNSEWRPGGTMDKRVAGGATDQYIGLNLALAYQH